MKRVDANSKKRVMDVIEKVNSEEYVTTYDEGGVPQVKKKVHVKRGRSAKARGARFELKVRADLEAKGKVVDKWSNNVDLEEGRIVAAKKKFNPFSKAMMISSGFPDFIAITKVHNGSYDVIGVEVKINGILSKIEKEKCRWYLENGTFSEIWIAKAIKEGRKIIIKYEDFIERHGK